MPNFSRCASRSTNSQTRDPNKESAPMSSQIDTGESVPRDEEKEISNGQEASNTTTKGESKTETASCCSEEADESCPICLNATERFVSGKCKHALCVECMELLLNANADVERCAPGAGWCSSCSDDGWLCASVQHLWVREDALQARDTSQCNLVLVTRRNADVKGCAAAHTHIRTAWCLAMMVAACVLASSPFGCRRALCKAGLSQSFQAHAHKQAHQ